MYIAHCKNNPTFEVQNLNTHLIGVSDLTESYAKKINLGSVGSLIGVLHDIGKYADAFQNYISSATGIIDQDSDDYVNSDSLKGKIDHSTCGAQYLYNLIQYKDNTSKKLLDVMAICIASHHSGLINFSPINNTTEHNGTLKARYLKDICLTNYNECISKIEDDVKNVIENNIDKSIDELKAGFLKLNENMVKNHIEPSLSPFYASLLIKMLFSCLIDGDRTDTANFERPYLKHIKRDYDWEYYIDRLNDYMNSLSNDGDINIIRKDVYNDCMEKAKCDVGIFTLTVPTGGGKTLSSLKFALDHAKKHNLDRIFYIIPYTSITDQTAKIAREIFGDDAILEHHSAITSDVDNWKTKTLSESWSCKLIFTTQVQFFNSFYAKGTRHSRRTHKLVNSVIVFDEVQSTPIKATHLLCNTINFLAYNCNSTIVLCTATQPSLNSISPTFGNIKNSNEISSNVDDNFKKLKRTNILYKKEQLTHEEICDLIPDNKSTLIVCNTKRDALTFYNLLKNSDYDVYHLSTSMCPMHRLDTIDIIKNKLKNKESIICVSTQLIECGVDIDFDFGIRLCAGLDSIIQTAGRVNRHGKKDVSPLIVVNLKGEVLHGLNSIQQSKNIATYFLSNGSDLSDPSVMSQYFTRLYANNKETLKYPHQEHNTNMIEMLSLNKSNSLFNQCFKDASDHFNLIDTATTPVVVGYKDGSVLINDLCSLPVDELWKIEKQCRLYTINLYENKFNELLQSGLIKEAQPDTGVYVLIDSYSNEIGIDENFLNFNPIII